jgi:hypothetical protein
MTCNTVKHTCLNFADHHPNIEAEWLALLLRIREVLDSNLGLDTGYPD